MPETVAQFAQRRHVARRTVIDWITRGTRHATRSGYGKTSPWLIDSEQPRQDSRDPRPVHPPRRKTALRDPASAATPTQPFANTPPHTAAEWLAQDELERQRDHNGQRAEPRYEDDPDQRQEPPVAHIGPITPADQRRADYLRRKLDEDW